MHGYRAEQLARQAKIIDMPTVSFEAQTAQPKPISITEIEYLTQFLHNHPSLRLEIIVNVNGKDPKKSFELSLERAQNLRRYISSLGIDIARIDVSGNGNSLYYRPNSAFNVSDVSIRFLPEEHEK